MSPRRVVFVAFPQFQILDLTGPFEVFAQAGGYRSTTVCAQGGALTASNGLTIADTVAVADLPREIDTLVAVGGPGQRAAGHDRRLTTWFADAARRSRRVASVCSGAFLLAGAGLLDGRRAVTHWASCAELARRFPAVTVDPDPIFIRDGHIWTSAGVTAGIDLALALVEDDLGAEVSRRIARQLVMFVQRPGGQAQFSTQLAAQRPAPEPVRGLQEWIVDHPAADLSVTALALRAGMSERHFARVFAATTGVTPAAYVAATRLEAARRLLETTDDTLDCIARACGFGTVETMHRCFLRRIRISPGRYRRRFSPKDVTCTSSSRSSTGSPPSTPSDPTRSFGSSPRPG